MQTTDTVLMIEHNLDVVKNCDWVIDLGPEGGDEGGEILFEGALSDLVNCERSYTAQVLNVIEKYFKKSKDVR